MDNPPKISKNLETETSKKEFSRVLEAILLNTKYSIPDLEFEFALDWDELSPMLDRSCTYTIEDGQIEIISKTRPRFTETELAELRMKREQEEKEHEETKEKLKQIYGITFYKTKEYRSMPKNDWPPEHTQLLEECIKLGIIQVWTHHGENPMLVLAGHLPAYNNRMRG